MFIYGFRSINLIKTNTGLLYQLQNIIKMEESQ
nr:MAG TPA: hypothetical protein [Bacteriophage sp.]